MASSEFECVGVGAAATEDEAEDEQPFWRRSGEDGGCGRGGGRDGGTVGFGLSHRGATAYVDARGLRRYRHDESAM